MTPPSHTHQCISQGIPFTFSEESLPIIQDLLTHYPTNQKRSALLPLLKMVQDQCQGWIPLEGVEYLATFLDIAPMDIMEVITFYSLFKLKPPKKYCIKVCQSLPCWLNGAHNIQDKWAQQRDENPDLAPYVEILNVECLGACDVSPVILLNEVYAEEQEINNLLKSLETKKKQENE